MTFTFPVLVAVVFALQGTAAELSDLQRAFAAGRHEEVVAKATAVLETNRSPELHLMRGRSYDELGDYARGITDYSAFVSSRSNSVNGWFYRACANFKLGRVGDACRDFSMVTNLAPEKVPELWQAGIALYYDRQFAAGQRQFEVHRQANPQDVENSVWHFLCVAELQGVAAARRQLIPVNRDSRVPMAEIFRLFSGEGSSAAVIEAAKRDAAPMARFHAELYLGLFEAVNGRFSEAEPRLKAAAEMGRSYDFMGAVPRVHLQQTNFYRQKVSK